jgi:nuclear pore complex protein Nup107
VGRRLTVRRNLRRALELANVVADGRHRLYDAFPGARAGPGGHALAEYLARVRAAVLGALEDRGGSDPFQIVKRA